MTVIGEHFEEVRTALLLALGWLNNTCCGTPLPRQMGKQQEAKQQQQAAAKPQAKITVEETPEERAARVAAAAPDDDVRRALSDPRVLQILEDPRMKQVMQEAGQPGRLSYYMGHPEFGPKLRLLAEKGLVKFA